MKNRFTYIIITMILFLGLMIVYPQRVSHAATKPDTPTSVRVWRYSDTKLRLKWNKVKKSDGYIIYKYDKTKKKYRKYKTIKNKNTVQFIDKVGKHTSAKYKISAYKKSGGKKLVSKKSHYVKARTYKQGDKKVNAGAVAASVKGEGSTWEELAYYESLSVTAKITPSKYSKAKEKKLFNQKIRWYSSNPGVAEVNKDGVVTAKAKKGTCSIYARAHNGRRSNKIRIDVKNYAKPGRQNLNIGAAVDNSDRYDFVLELLLNNYNTVTDIAEYFYINQPKGTEEFKCQMIDGEVILSPENFVPEEIRQMIYNFVRDFTYDVRISVTPGYVNFTKMYWGVDYLGMDQRKAGPNVIFLFDKSKTDPYAYDENERHELTTNWYYGDFWGI